MLKMTDIPPIAQGVTPRQLAKGTFRDMLTAWTYCGFKEIELEFVIPYDPKSFEIKVRHILLNDTLEDALGFVCRVLKRAVVPGVIEYTIAGVNGRR